MHNLLFNDPQYKSLHFLRIILFVLSLCIFSLITAQKVNADNLYQSSGTDTASTGSPSVTQSTDNPVKSPTSSASPTITPTTTLVPLPVFTLVFPAPTNTSTATITPVIAATTSTPQLVLPNGNSNLSSRYLLLEVLLGCLWVILIVFAIFYIRQYR